MQTRDTKGATLIYKITDEAELHDPNVVKVTLNQSGQALYFSRSVIPFPREENVGVRYMKHIGIYAFRKDALMDFYTLPMLSLEASEKLEQLFAESSEINGENISNDISGLIGQYAHGNEPSHHIAYLFNHANKPWLTQYWVNQILKTQYNTTPDGLSGNEDCGQMSAWYVFSSMGLYSMNPVSGNYEIGSPLFEKTTLSISDEIFFIIEAF